MTVHAGLLTQDLTDAEPVLLSAVTVDLGETFGTVPLPRLQLLAQYRRLLQDADVLLLTTCRGIAAGTL
jgi:hypothetical protein